MKNDGKITGPVFQTFDTSSVNYKPTRMEIDVRVLENILSLLQESPRPLMAGQIALWYDLRMNTTIACLEMLIDQKRAFVIETNDLKDYGLSEHAVAYWVPEKATKRI